MLIFDNLFATNSDFPIPTSLQLRRYFKVWILLDKKSKFEISKIYSIRLRRRLKILVRGKDSIFFGEQMF